MFIPMINPDGVYNGYYRMDYYNQNLNRYYKTPDFKKQPQIYAIKELVEYLNSESRLVFYCDLHAHAARKGCFIYGNALDYLMQVESQLYAKVVSMNCVNFEYETCNFSKKQMSSRDRGETLTKEGAGRVCVYKICNVIHSYTLECGFHYSTHLNRIAPPSKVPKNFSKFACIEDDLTNVDSPIYSEQPTYYTIEIYQDIGKSMLISLLDIFEKNPCTRIINTPYQNISGVRKEIAGILLKYNRFKKDVGIRKKCKKIDENVKEIFYNEFIRKNVFLEQKPHNTFKVFPIERKSNQTQYAEDRKNRNFPPQRLGSLGGSRNLKESPTIISLRSSGDEEMIEENFPTHDRLSPDKKRKIKKKEKSKDKETMVVVGKGTRKEKTPNRKLAWVTTIKVGKNEIFNNSKSPITVVESATLDKHHMEKMKSMEEKFDVASSQASMKSKENFAHMLKTSMRVTRNTSSLGNSSLLTNASVVNPTPTGSANGVSNSNNFEISSQRRSPERDRDKERERESDKHEKGEKVDKLGMYEKFVEKVEKMERADRIEKKSNDKSNRNSSLKLPVLKADFGSGNQMTPVNVVTKGSMTGKKFKIVDSQKSYKKIVEVGGNNLLYAFASTHYDSSIGH